MSDSELVETEAVNLAEVKNEDIELQTIDDPLVQHCYHQGLEIARLTNQVNSDQAFISHLQEKYIERSDQLEKLRIAHDIQTQIVANQEADIKTLKDNLNAITQSFNVCRSMLIHIGEVMKVIEDQRAYIQSLVSSPAVQEHIGG